MLFIFPIMFNNSNTWEKWKRYSGDLRGKTYTRGGDFHEGIHTRGYTPVFESRNNIGYSAESFDDIEVFLHADPLRGGKTFKI